MAFRFCVSGCACVSALCFGLACVSDLCFELGGFVFRAWVSVCGFDVWVTGFRFGGFRRLAMADFVAVGLLVPGGGSAAFFYLFFL